MDTKVSERIRIRLSSGQIKGPYTRQEVILRIKKGRFDGSEEIFLESEGQWKPIGAETEFFDLIQEVQFGVRGGTNISDRGSPKKGWSDSAEKKEASKVDSTEKLQFGRDTQNIKSQQSIQNINPFQIETPSPQLNNPSRNSLSENNVQVSPSSKGVQGVKGFEDLSSTVKEKPKKFQGLFLIVFVLLVAYFFSDFFRGANEEVSQKINLEYKFDFKKGYFRPLLLRLKLVPQYTVPVQTLTVDFEKLKVLSLSVHDLLMTVDENEANAEANLSASSWILKAWTFRVVGDALSVADPKRGGEFKKASQALLVEIEKNIKLPEEIKQLFAALDLFLAGDFEKSLKTIESLQVKPLVVKSFYREISYWASLMPEYRQNIKALNVLAEEDLLALPIRAEREERVRKSFNGESFNDGFIKKADDFLSFEAHSLLAWYLISKYNIDKFRGNPQVPNRYFFTGFCELSLYPKILQVFYWKQYAQFVSESLSGDSAQISATVEAIRKGEFEASPTVVDLDDPFFKFSSLLENYKKAFEQNEMNNIERSSFQVVSEASPKAKDNLISVVTGPLLDKNWSVAERQIRLLEKTFPFDEEIKTLRIWFEGERFRFEKAIEILNSTFSGSFNNIKKEQLKAEGILYMVAQDFEKGSDNLKLFLEVNKQDGLSQYFIARGAFELEKYTECVRYSQLAQFNSSGPLKLRSQILNYRCRIKANLAMDASLREFAQFVERFSQTAVAREEYIRALLDADQSQEALKIAEKDVVDNPDSPSLKILLGEVYERRGLTNEALLMYNEARKLEPQRARSSIHIGDLYMKEKRFKEAAQSYINAGSQDNEFPELFLKAARAYRKAGDIEKAKDMYFKEVILRPGVIENFLEASEFFLESNLPAQVPAIFKLYGQDFNSDSRVLTRLAQSYYALGDPTNALRNANLAIKINNKEAEPYRILGYVYNSQGQYSLAKINFEKYLVLLPQANDAAELRQKLSLPPYSSQ
jgi:tetratricopeptide (TPR) repeat protein